MTAPTAETPAGTSAGTPAEEPVGAPDPAGALELHIHEADYPALNCRAGIFAGVLRAHWSVDPSPLFLRTAVAAPEVLAPMERGEIAGFTFGSFDDAAWTDLFGAAFEEWHPRSAEEMALTLDRALDRHGLVLSAQDGYWNPLAADKYQRRHMRHNVLVHGRTGDGGYLVADRAHRTVLDAGTLWRCMEEPTTTFVAVTAVHGLLADPARLLAEGGARLTAALGARLTDAEVERVAAAVAADLRAPDERWLQTHFFLNGVGRSRALFADGLAALAAHAAVVPVPGVPGPEEAAPALALLERAAQGWVLTGRLVYKRVTAGRGVGAEELLPRVRAAEAADAAALEAVAALVATLPGQPPLPGQG